MFIMPPKRETEFEVKAELYCKLKEKGFNVRGPVTSDDSRFDLVVFDKDNNVKCIIEVKKWKPEEVKKKSNRPKTKTQHEKYNKYNLPLLTCYRSNLNETIEDVTKLFVC